MTGEPRYFTGVCTTCLLIVFMEIVDKTLYRVSCPFEAGKSPQCSCQTPTVSLIIHNPKRVGVITRHIGGLMKFLLGIVIGFVLGIHVLMVLLGPVF